jgi:hypothetical protein
MATTNNLGITLVEQSQAQKEVTVNQAFTRIDSILNTGAVSRSVSTPPGSPATGDLYIVAASPTGDWTGQAGKLAYFDQIWRFIAPNEGMSLWVNDEDIICTHDGSSWIASTFGEVNTASNLGAGNGVFAAKVGADLRFKSLVAGTNVTISNTGTDITINASGGGGGFYQTVQEEGGGLTQRAAINFIGGGITASDNAGSSRTDVTLDATLNALASYNTNGIITQTAADTFAGRSIVAPAAGITVSNGNGVSGNPTLALADDLGAVEALATTGYVKRTATDTWSTAATIPNTDITGLGTASTQNSGAFLQPSNNLSDVSNVTTARSNLGLAIGSNVQAFDSDLSALAANSSDGLWARTGAGTGAARTLTGGGGITVTNGNGVSGNPALGVSALQTLWIPAAAMRPATTNGCSSLNQVEIAANQPEIVTLDFDPATEQYALFSVAFRKGWNEGTITAEIYWSHPSTATNFGTVWGLQAVATSNDDALGVAFGTAQEVTDTGGTTNDIYRSPVTSAITISGSPADGDVVHFRVYRKAANGSNTLAVSARLHGIKLFYTIDSMDDA